MRQLPSEFVLDANVAVKLFLAEEHSAEAQALIESVLLLPGSELHVPDLFFTECANVFWKASRWHGYPEQAGLSALERLEALRLSVTATRDLVTHALGIACQHGISVYDACYVALAADKDIPLLTADNRLRGMLAGTSLDIVVLGP